MYVRITRAEGATRSADDAARLFEQQIMPPMRQMPGFRGAILLRNPATGVGISATYWEDEGALKASEEAMAKLRGQAVQTAGARVTDVDSFEIVVWERAAPPTAHSFVRINDVQGTPDKIENGIRFVRETVVPLLKPIKGFRAVIMGVNRQTGRGFLTSVWDTAEDRAASESVVAGTRAQGGESLGGGQVNVEEFEAVFVELNVPATTPAS